MDTQQIETALTGLPLGPLRYYERTGSTNAEAARWIEVGAPHLALVIADEQTAGRGRQGRTWFTPPGAALAFSLVLKNISGHNRAILSLPEYMARLTALGALAVCQALHADYGLQAQIKWPNDVLLGRRKVAGVLAEAHWQGNQFGAAILGIGINVAPAAVPADNQIIFPATCVETALGRSLPRLELLRSMLAHLLEWHTRLNEPEFLRTWEDLLAFRNEWVNIITGTDEANQQVHQGLVLGLDTEGCLQLRNPAGEIFTVRTGEVRLRPQADSVIS